MSGVGPTNPAVSGPEWGTVTVATSTCYCDGWYRYKGDESDMKIAAAMGWVVFVSAILVILANLFLLYRFGRPAIRWENIWIMMVLTTFYGFQNFYQWDSICMMYLSTGNFVVMLRYIQWLLATPCISSLVADMTGCHDGYSAQDMMLVLADVWGVTFFVACILSINVWAKAFGYTLSLISFIIVFYLAGRSFKKLADEVPSKLRKLAKATMLMYFLGQNVHTLFSTIGPEVANWINAVQTEIGATWGDMTAKVAFCTMATILNFLAFRYRQKEELENPKPVAVPEVAAKELPEAPPKPELKPGVVVLAVPDDIMIAYFQEQFKQLPADIELVPAIGARNAVVIVEAALESGEVDCVLVHPAFLRESNPQANLAVRLKMMGQRVCAFDYDAAEGQTLGWMLDGWLTGAVDEKGIDIEELTHLLVLMQSLQKAKGEANGLPALVAPASAAPVQAGGAMTMGQALNNMAAQMTMRGMNPLYVGGGQTQVAPAASTAAASKNVHWYNPVDLSSGQQSPPTNRHDTQLGAVWPAQQPASLSPAETSRVPLSSMVGGDAEASKLLAEIENLKAMLSPQR